MNLKDVKANYKDSEIFNFFKASTEDINKTIKSLNHRKATGADKVPPKLLKTAANVVDSHIASILDHNLLNKRFPEKTKIANACPIYKKEPRKELENCRPVSIFNASSEICESFILRSTGPNMLKKIYP